MQGAMRTAIRVRSRFEALHYWPGAPSSEGTPDSMFDTAFLRHPHRHEFQVTVVCPVAHNDRAIEFFELRDEIEHVTDRWHRAPEAFELSCEQFAADIMQALWDEGYKVSEVSVSEDGQHDGVATAHDLD